MNACINIVKPWKVALFLLLWLTSFVSAKDLPIALFAPSPRPIPSSVVKDLPVGLRVVLDQAKAKEIWEKEPSSFEATIPMPGGQVRQLTFHKTKLFTDDFSILTSDGRVLSGKEYTGVHYQINSLVGKEKVGTMSFTKTGLVSLISDKEGNWNIGPLPNGNGDYIIYNDQDLKVKSPFLCEAPDEEPAGGKGHVEEEKSVETTGSCRTIKIYFECDYKMYQDNGSSVANTSNTVAGLFNGVSQMYMNEQIAVEISQIFVWTTADAYPASGASANLTAFRTLRTTFNGTLAHLLTTKPAAMGGVAYLNVLCNTFFSYGFSNIYNTYSSLPNYSWTVHCVTHELGHNMGSNHTHWCGWQLTSTTTGPIDRCYAQEPYNGVSCGTTTTAQVGTVMSYCHLNGSVNLALGFGTLPGNKIRTGFNGATCITGAALPFFSVSAPSAVCVGENIALKATSVASATYAWIGPNGFTSALQNPSISSASSAANGTYNCTVSKSGCTTDPKPVTVVVNTPTLGPVAEGFDGTYPSSGWRNINPNGDITWTKYSGVGGFGNSTTCVRFNNFSYPAPTGTRDTIMLPVVNLSGQTGSTLKFDVAYAYNGYYNDTLVVAVSGNCGKSFTRVYAKTKTTLATAPNTTNPFTPTSTQWRQETIDLSAFNGNGTVQVAFVNVCGGSNYLYLDNINLSSTAGAGSPTITLGTITQSTFCPGSTLIVPFSPSGTFNSGNSFSVQLSNASGSFASPITIGTGTTSPISVTIPGGSTSGSGYLLRIVASNPAVNSGNSGALTISPLSVSTGASQTTCSNGSALTLTGTPSGGTWSGNGVNASGVFTPSTSLIGTQTLTYSVSQSGCSGSNTTTVVVNAQPTVSAGGDISTCASASAFSLTGFSPTGGTWSGNGVSSSGVFTPTSALIGSQTITYTVTQNGCTATDSRLVTVAASISVDAGTSQSLCSNAASITLIGTPAGGIWSGSGVSSSGIFTPSAALVGTQTLTYTVTGTCGGSDQIAISVNALPNTNAGIDRSFCSSDASFTIAQGTPAGGTWSGSSAVTSSGDFTISAATVGTHNLVYSVTQNGCTKTDLTVFTVNPIPGVSVGSDQVACSGSGSVTLTGLPAGGTWVGNGVTSGGIFTPSGSNIGSNQLTYSVVQNGCSGSASLNFTVNPVPVAAAGSDQTTTTAGADISLNGSPTGGTWSGTGVTPSGVFSPAASGAGTFTLTYTVTQNGCTDTDELVIQVNPAATVSAGSDITICETADPVSLSGTPLGGTWSGNGVTSNGIFTPNSSLVGSQVLTYSVSGIGSAQINVNVIVSPLVSAGADKSLCSSSTTYTISGATPAGGTWSGSGVSSSGVVTISQLSTSGTSLTYTVTSGGCTSTSSVLFTRVDPPVVNAGNGQNLCANAGAIQLNGNPQGGNWTGNGVNASGQFTPSSSIIGNNTLTYTVQGSIPGCSGSSQVTMSVFALPNVTAGSDRSTCESSAPFTLSGNPAGGSWAGNGVSLGGLFTPTSSLVGVQTLTYSYTQNGCTNSASMDVTVNVLPNVSVGSAQTICTNSPTFIISGATPSGGTWSGPSFVSSSGTCSAPFATGNYNLTYTVTQNGCSASAQVQYTVNPAPIVNAGNNRFSCTNGASIQLTGFTPAGGIWSGPGVSTTGVFSPTTALAGNQTLTYTVTQNGCTASDNIMMTVRSAPAITTGPNHTACESGTSFKISGYSPTGGVWTGPGITNDSIFTPVSSLIGTQTITYTVTKNGCSNTAQKTVTVTPGNNISIGNYPTSLCSNSSPITFSGFLPSGGTWKGAGISPNGTLTVTPSLVGNQVYTYKLTLNGCRDSVQVLSTIQSIPLVSAGPDISVCATGAAVALLGATPANGTWSGPGVTDSGIFNPATVQVGVQSLTYSVTQNGCTGTDLLTVNVQSSPSVNAGADRNICKNSIPITLVGVPFGGTWSGTGVSPTGLFTPSASMSGNITLTYTLNQSGCTGTDQVILSITNPVSVSAGTNQSICSNAESFTLAGFSPAGGTWTGNGVTNSGIFSPDTSLIGTQTLTYTVTKNNCTVQATKTVTVNSAPFVVAGNDQTLCNNVLPTQLSGFSPTGGSWSGSGVNPIGLFTPTSSMTGLVTLTYSVTQGGCTESDTKVLTLIPAPNVDAGSDITGCGLSSITMTNFFPAGGTWSGGGISDIGVFTPTPSNLGNSVTVTYSVSQNGCTSSDTRQINIVDIPGQVTLSSASGTTACEGQSIPLEVELVNCSVFNIQWKKDGSDILAAVDSLLNVTQSGTYQALVKVSSCSVTSESKTITFNSIPGTPTITTNGNSLLSSASSGNQWRRNGVDIPGATQQTYTPTQSGIYTVVVNSGNCSSEPSLAYSFAFTEDEDLVEQFDLQLYPNPNDGKFQIEISGVKSNELQLLVVNSNGQKVWSQDIRNSGEESIQMAVQMPPLPSGIYWLQIRNGTKPLLKKIVLH